MEKLEPILEEILGRKFPGAIVHIDPDFRGDDGTPFYNVFMLPDDDPVAFTKFYIDELWKIMDERGIKMPHFSEVSVSDTKQFYPEIFEEYQKKNLKRRTGRAHRSVKPRSTKSATSQPKPVASRK